MSSTSKPKLYRRTATIAEYGVLNPYTFWGHVVDRMPIVNAGLLFEDRAARACTLIISNRLRAPEYGQLRIVLTKIITTEATTVVQPREASP
jgi:hypothetical protein